MTMADPVIANPNVSDRSNTTWWAAPIGVGVVLANPVFMSDLPTSDPLVAGQLYNNSGVVTESTGS
jgi:hypothetical protein